MKKQVIAKAVALLAIGVLHGCGGGGGGGGGGGAFLPIAAAPAAPPAAPAPAPEPQPPAVIPPEAPSSTDPTACITAPQPGSTAAVGNGYEGVWHQPAANGSNGLMLIGATGDAIGFTVPASSGTYPIESMFHGAFSFDTSNSSWQIASGKVNAYPSATWGALSGSGTFVPKTTLDGSYAEAAATPKPFGPWKYEIENSLAVDSTLLTGAWGGFMTQILGTINIASDGSFTGSTATSSPMGVCALTGSVLPREAGTLKNNLRVMFNSTDAAQSGQKSCAMGALQDGTAFVNVTQSTTDGVCKRSMNLYMFFKDATGNQLATLSFPK
jgi:hypothetical protein